MKRILSMVALMVAMLALTAAPAFAQALPPVGHPVHPLNHGALVSTAAHTCPHGPHGLHGHCVSTVAHQHLP
jgi:hypothetical protein